MGGKGSGRLNKTDSILKKYTEKVTGIAQPEPAKQPFTIPNLSGDHSAGSVTQTPTADTHIPNKKYVDTLTTNHPHQDVKTTASPSFVGLDTTSGQVTFVKTTAPQLILSGDDYISSPTAASGALRLGTNDAYYGQVNYNGQSGVMMIRNMYNNDNGDINFYTKGGSTGMVLKGSGNLTLNTGDFDVTAGDIILTGASARVKVINRGTKTLPLIYPSNDPDTGIFFEAGAGAGWTVGGQRRMYCTGTDINVDVADFRLVSNSSHLRLGVGEAIDIRYNGTDFLIDGTAVPIRLKTSSTITVEGADLIFTDDGSGLPYGSCYGDHIGWSQAAATQNTWYNISDADMVDGELNLVTHDSSGKLTVLKAGRYLINYSITWEDNVANDHTEIGIEITGSGSANAAGITHSETKFANEEQTQSGTAIISLAANATIEIAIRTTDAATPTISVQDMNITAVMVGG